MSCKNSDYRESLYMTKQPHGVMSRRGAVLQMLNHERTYLRAACAIGCRGVNIADWPA